MAVDTTVEVVMPAMGDSVSEGTILEWHKQEGDHVAADETLVEISTDKVDAEVPAPATGHRRQDPRRRGRHRRRRRGARRDRRQRRRRRRPTRPRTRPPTRRPPRARPSTSSCPRWASRSPRARPRVAKQPGDAVAEDETIVEISTDKVDAEVPAPAAGTITEILAAAGDTVDRRPGHRAHDARRNGRAAEAPPRRSRPRRPTPDGRRPTAAPARDGAKVSPVAAASPPPRASTSRASTAPGPAAASPRPTCSPPRPTARPPRQPPASADADQGRAGDARPLHGRVALDPDRDLVPHAHRHDARRAPQAAQGRPASASPSRT